MDKEMLDILNDLSKKPTTELALQIMELSGENLILKQQMEKQQKEFVKYLESMLDDENDIFSVVRVKDVLQKYKEIIGDDK